MQRYPQLFSGLKVLALAGLLSSCVEVHAEETPAGRRQPHDEAFHAKLEQLAAKCEQLGLPEQAKETRNWRIERAPDRQVLFLPTESSPKPPAGNQLVTFWREHFLKIRAEHAENLFELARDEAKTGNATAAFQWVHEVLREDPDHAEARRMLGYVRRGSNWLTPVENPKPRAPAAGHPEFGWRSGRYWRVETDHFRITTNHSIREGVKLAARLEQLYAAWRQVFFEYHHSARELQALFESGTMSASRRKHNVVLFNDRQEYIRQMRSFVPGAEVSSGYYVDGKQTSYFFAGDANAERVWLHEATHQLFHELGETAAQVAERADVWAVEGIAIYMESLEPFEGYATLGGVEADRLQFARYRALDEKAGLPFEKLAALGRLDLQEHEEVRQLYSQAAGLAHMFMDDQGGLYRTNFVRYLRSIYSGRSTPLPSLIDLSPAEIDREYLNFLEVDDEDLSHIARPDLLRNLSLGHTKVTDAGLTKLGSCPELLWLNLDGASVTDAALGILRESKNLQQLFLSQTKVTDAALEFLDRCDDLEELDLTGTQITDDALAKLGQKKKLRILFLGQTSITDQGIAALRGLKQLELLDLQQTAVTPQAEAELRRGLPKLQNRE